MPYRIQYSSEAVDHLRLLTARQRATVMGAVRKQLAYSPTEETRQRKPMRPNPLAPWELRVGNLRVYYSAQANPEPVVSVLAVGMKERNQVRVGGEVMDL
jgi:mRNA-degrading endonuclease RelE of RelBE toxin-antitoxin system